MRAIDCGGLGLIQLLVEKLGLAESIDQRVKVLARHLPYRESDHVLNLIYNVMSGGSCLQDMEERRQDPGYLDALGAKKVPAPSTEGDFLRRLDEVSVWGLMEAVDEARLKVWGERGEKFHGQATIDVDGSMAVTQGECKRGDGTELQGGVGVSPAGGDIGRKPGGAVCGESAWQPTLARGSGGGSGQKYRSGSPRGFSESTACEGIRISRRPAIWMAGVRMGWVLCLGWTR